MKLTKKDIKEILSGYVLGKLKSFHLIERRLNTLNPSLIVNTTKGKFFLKIYTKQFRRFKYHIIKGLDLLLFLEKKKYPSIKVFKTKKGKPHGEHKKIFFAIFEFLNIKEKKISNEKQAYELGKNLGKLHKLAKNFPILKTGQGYNSFKTELEKNRHLINKCPKKYKKRLEDIKKNFNGLKIKSNQPKSVCHVEFTSQHVRFKGNKLVKIIDWDEVGRDYMFYDLGTSLTESFNKNSINFKILSSILRGYQNQRKLTPWESNHIYEAILFGICKFVIWGLDKEEIEKSGWDRIGLQNVEFLMKMGKNKFNQMLK